MPEDIEERLIKENLMEAYRRRPPYQQNDYLGWILKAKRPETREKRITQMLEELRRGDNIWVWIIAQNNTNVFMVTRRDPTVGL
ncbi:MAG: YdeI/OmpD-associated family protein [Clostridiaceae bacterium]|nr:YdeI/OmpD-associated family protein [Clostridiaceae bacterium]